MWCVSFSTRRTHAFHSAIIMKNNNNKSREREKKCGRRRSVVLFLSLSSLRNLPIRGNLECSFQKVSEKKKKKPHDRKTERAKRYVCAENNESIKNHAGFGWVRACAYVCVCVGCWNLIDGNFIALKLGLCKSVTKERLRWTTDKWSKRIDRSMIRPKDDKEVDEKRKKKKDTLWNVIKLQSHLMNGPWHYWMSASKSPHPYPRACVHMWLSTAFFFYLVALRWMLVGSPHLVHCDAREANNGTHTIHKKRNGITRTATRTHEFEPTHMHTYTQPQSLISFQFNFNHMRGMSFHVIVECYSSVSFSFVVFFFFSFFSHFSWLLLLFRVSLHLAEK